MVRDLSTSQQRRAEQTSQIEELAEAIGALVDKIGEATTDTAGVTAQSDQTSDAANALGAIEVVKGLAEVKERLENLATTLTGAADEAGQIRDFVLSVADGT
jgi:hypothetical protein